LVDTCAAISNASVDPTQRSVTIRLVSPSPTRVRLDWVVAVLLPVVNLAVALLLSAVVVLLIGESPGRALRTLASGAFGDAESIGYTLYYASNFVFTGLAVAVAFHCGLFNIGAEGQAYIGGLGVALFCLGAGSWPTVLVVPVAIVVAAVGGAAWAFVPAWLQAHRGSHVVITTIMFNFIASSLMTYLLVNVLIKPGQQSPETREFAPSTWLPQLHDVVRSLGWEIGRSPLNLAFVFSLLAGALVWFYLWHTRWGYELRAFGLNATAAVYGGIPPAATVIAAMAISGALAGLMSLNEVMGVQHRLLLNMPGGAGYVVRYEAPWTDFPTEDAVADAARMNRWIESEIRKNPAQYLWVHRRFKTRPPGEPPLY